MPIKSLIKSTNEKNLLRLMIIIREFKQFINTEQAKLDLSNVAHTQTFDFLEGQRLEVDLISKDYTYSINRSMQNNVLVKTELVDEAKDRIEGIRQKICETIACINT